MFLFNEIKTLQLEISNYCNAACPQCPRNFFGGQTMPTLPLRKWSLTEFKQIFSEKLINQLEQVYFCGTYGDPMTNTQVDEMCKFLHDTNKQIKIGLHTNGGVGKRQLYVDLPKYVDFVAFGIDGLEDTNHVYRRNVKWSKVIDNACAFIDAGGYAIWDFIVFEHNQHQVEQARALSKQLGFKEFNVKKTSRFLSRDHVYDDKLLVQNNKGFIDYTISLPTDARYVNENYAKLNFVKQQQSISDYATTTDITCNAQRIKEIYIGAEGFVFPCGWLHDRLYGPEVETHKDHLQIKQLMANAGGWDKVNVFYTPLRDIVNGQWFQEIEASWTNQNRLERCGIMCGKTVNLIKSQNDDVQYKP